MSDRHGRGLLERGARVLGSCLRCAGAAALGSLLGPALASHAHAQVQVIAPEPDVANPDSVPERHKVVDGETLSSLAERFLGNGDSWPKLWSYNPEITNPHWIYPGLVLKLKNGTASAPEPEEASAGPTSASKTGFLRFAAQRKAAAGLGTVVVGEQVYLDRDALDQAAKIAGSAEDHFMVSPTDEVYLKFKDGSEPTVGREVIVFLRLHRSEVVPSKRGRLKNLLNGDGGEIVRVVGALRVTSYDAERHIARAVVTEAMDPIERGYEVADMPRRLASVPPKTNAKDVQGTIVAAAQPLGTLGDSQVVFLSAGEKQGVQVGNRFLVVRQGDPWRKNLLLRERLSGETRPDPHPLPNDAFPPEVVGELRVLYVRPETSTALITSSNEELNPGDHVEMRAGY